MIHDTLYLFSWTWREPGRFGGASRDRTDDLRVANATLSQLSYGPVPWIWRTSSLENTSLWLPGNVTDGGSGRS